MADDVMKAWTCSGNRSHVLGQVKRNGSGVRQLMMYRVAVDTSLSAEELADVDVIAVVEGYVADVRCSICGRVRTWVPGQESMNRLLEQARRMRTNSVRSNGIPGKEVPA